MFDQILPYIAPGLEPYGAKGKHLYKYECPCPKGQNCPRILIFRDVENMYLPYTTPHMAIWTFDLKMRH